MEIVVQLFVEIVGQLVGERLLELGVRPLGRLFRTARAELLVVLVLCALGGFVGGLLWGTHVTEAGRTNEPTSLWVSLALALAFFGLAVLTTGRGHLSRGRLAGYAVVNVAVAIGIALGFDPMPRR